MMTGLYQQAKFKGDVERLMHISSVSERGTHYLSLCVSQFGSKGRNCLGLDLPLVLLLEWFSIL